jgi:hypothetical protein
MRRRFLTAICISALAWVCFGQDMPVPVSAQVPVIFKVLSYDRNLRRHASDKLVIGVVYQKSVRESEAVAVEFMQAFAAMSDPRVNGLSVSVVPIDISSGGDLQTILASRAVDAVYLAPLVSESVREISSIARTSSITTLTGVPDYVERGCSVGVTLRGGRISLLINLAACHAEGSRFDPQLLRLAQTIDDGE